MSPGQPDRQEGRKSKMTPEVIGKAQRMYDSRQFTMAEIASFCAVTPDDRLQQHPHRPAARPRLSTAP